MRQLLLYYLNLDLDEQDTNLVRSELAAEQRKLARQTMSKIQEEFRRQMEALSSAERWEHRLEDAEERLKRDGDIDAFWATVVEITENPSWSWDDLSLKIDEEEARELLDFDDPQVRKDAAKWLAGMGGAARASIPALERLLDDEVADVRETAARAIEQIESDLDYQPKTCKQRRIEEVRNVTEKLRRDGGYDPEKRYEWPIV